MACNCGNTCKCGDNCKCGPSCPCKTHKEDAGSNWAGWSGGSSGSAGGSLDTMKATLSNKKNKKKRTMNMPVLRTTAESIMEALKEKIADKKKEIIKADKDNKKKVIKKDDDKSDKKPGFPPKKEKPGFDKDDKEKSKDDDGDEQKKPGFPNNKDDKKPSDVNKQSGEKEQDSDKTFGKGEDNKEVPSIGNKDNKIKDKENVITLGKNINPIIVNPTLQQTRTDANTDAVNTGKAWKTDKMTENDQMSMVMGFQNVKPAKKRCPTCQGAGKIHNGHKDCPECGGSGFTDLVDEAYGDHPPLTTGPITTKTKKTKGKFIKPPPDTQETEWFGETTAGDRAIAHMVMHGLGGLFGVKTRRKSFSQSSKWFKKPKNKPFNGKLRNTSGIKKYKPIHEGRFADLWKKATERRPFPNAYVKPDEVIVKRTAVPKKAEYKGQDKMSPEQFREFMKKNPKAKVRMGEETMNRDEEECRLNVIRRVLREAQHSLGGGDKGSGSVGQDSAGDDHPVNVFRKAISLGKTQKFRHKDSSTSDIHPHVAHKLLTHYGSLRTSDEKEHMINQVHGSKTGMYHYLAGKKYDSPSKKISLGGSSLVGGVRKIGS